MIRRVLVANRGEIALRVMRACRAMGIGTVAVYSDADAEAPHVAAADRALRIGPAPARESYLNIPALIEAALRTKADAVHPGYGFLSENAAFARACEEAGITFVGPPSGVIGRMGSKPSARETMRAAGVPVVPGATAQSQAAHDLERAANDVGYPLLLKAAAGGGGKGMRAVRSSADLAEAIGGARREAERAFGDGTLYVERLLEHARHVEVQILADAHGSAVHLFERDCSLQRRHQKVIEESPAPTLAPGVRDRLTRAAVDAARAVGYVNAGTVEFLLHGVGESAEFYFLEMNTRLQVEHPVTEAITGLDLVQAQLLVAGGERLPFRQDDIRTRGHAIECRVYAEDPSRLLPQSGRLLRYREPALAGIRIDSGVREGQTITAHYDPMLAKLIAHAPTRGEAIDAAAGALRALEILGIHHNIPFLIELLGRPEVRTANADTHFIDDHLDELRSRPSERLLSASAAVAAMASRVQSSAVRSAASAGLDPWQTIGPINW
jgi:acetyl-CoA carboxylase biotin carboxylase subunit